MSAQLVQKRPRGNPRWTTPGYEGDLSEKPTAFELKLTQLRLPNLVIDDNGCVKALDAHVRSRRLRDRSQRNRNSKYIPEPLLEAWRFEPDRQWNE